jgi:hypothetical protein
MAYRQFVCWVRKGQPLGKKNQITPINQTLLTITSVQTINLLPFPEGIFGASEPSTGPFPFLKLIKLPTYTVTKF